jgi:hypothetical protein
MDIVNIIKTLRVALMTSQVVTTNKHRELTKFFGDYCLSSGDSDFEEIENRNQIDNISELGVHAGEYDSQQFLNARSDLSTGDRLIEKDPEDQPILIPNFDPDLNKVDKVIFDNIVYEFR